jgi:hypothetical protein
MLLEYEVEFRTPADLALTAANSASTSVDPTPEELMRQIAELQRVLGIERRLVKKAPPPILLPDGETKDVDSYVSVDEPFGSAGSHTSQVAPVQQPVSSRQDARKDGVQRQALGNMTPLSLRSRPN